MPFDAVTQAALPSREVTELHLLRHGEVDTGGQRLAYGHLDLPLSARGQEDAEDLRRLATALPKPAGVLSSDLQRCQRTAARIAQDLGVPLVCTPALREQHMGAWEGRPWGALTAEDDDAIQAYWADYVRAAPPGGESLAQLSERVLGWWQAEQATLRGRRWIVVTHIGVIRSLLCALMQRPLDQALRWAPARASHTHLLVAEAGAVLQCLGERARPPSAAAPQRAARRVALSGSAGVGKTTLGRALAARLNLPFIEEGMRRHIEGGLELHSLGQAGMKALIWELWEEQRAAEQAAVRDHGGFVADRSSVDFAAFWLFYGFSYDAEETARFMAATLGEPERYDRVLLLPWGLLPLVADGVRSPNPWLQRHFQALVEGLLRQEIPPDLLAPLPPIDGLDARVDWAAGALGWR